jgi:hypothetical protein
MVKKEKTTTAEVILPICTAQSCKKNGWEAAGTPPQSYSKLFSVQMFIDDTHLVTLV